MRPSQTLFVARQLIRHPDQLCRSAYARDALGNPLWDAADTSILPTSYCVRGALFAAAGLSIADGDVYAGRTSLEMTISPVFYDVVQRRHPPLRAAQPYFYGERDHFCIANFANDPVRSHAEILAVIDDTIAELRRSEVAEPAGGECVAA